MDKKSAKKRGREPICPNCGWSARLYNPSKACDHLYWPDNLTESAKHKIGSETIARIRAALSASFHP